VKPIARRTASNRAALVLALVLPFAGALPVAAREAAPSSPALWRALRPNGAEAFYLIGSVHLGRRSLLRFPRVIDDAYRRSAELVLETGADDLGPGVAQRLAERYARIAPPATLRDRVSQSTLAELTRYLAARRDTLERYLHLEPWFVAQQIEAREAQRVGLEAEFGIDRHFASRAAREKPVIGLETAESQMQVLAWLPRATQEQLLRDAIEHAHDVKNGSEGVARAWARGDDRELERIIYRAMAESPQLSTYYEQMLIGRNESMAQRLASLARDGKLRFVVVGVGHMVASAAFRCCCATTASASTG
jgi:uncharacterized protein YbaP (TraB family)